MKIKKIVALIFVLILLVIGYVLWQAFGPVIKNPDKKYLYIPTGTNYEELKRRLDKNGMLGHFIVFDRIANYIGYPEKVKPGKYKINSGMSVYQLLKNLRAGKQEPVNLVITKLRTKEDLAKKIASNFEIDSLTIINFLNNKDSLLPFAVDTNTVMTDVIPNTYTFYWNATIKQIFQKFYNEEQKFWNEDRRAKARRMRLSPKEVYIMASIVEEETNMQNDKGLIASVYLNRIRKGMRLAADPTVKFAMRDFGLKRIYHKHLEFVSPYNTYLNSGLPPGPICTPSIKTIDGVLDAPETNYLFFVARSDFSGYSDFAETYQQHLVYAKAYQEALNAAIKARQEKAATETAN